MSRISYSLALAAALCAGASVAAAQAPAQSSAARTAPVTITTVPASINITPRRLTFDHTHRTGTVYIYNQGGSPATVDITLVDRVMLPDGQIVAAEEAAKTPARKAFLDRLKSAQAMVQVAPRRVTLQPGKGQTIRLRIGDVPDAPADAEYRTHLTVTTIPPRDSGLTAEEAATHQGANQLSFHINAVYGLSIPLIIRVGAPDVKAELTDLHVETRSISVDGRSPPKPTPVLTADLVRAGTSSLFGNIEVRPAGDKHATPIGAARGVGVYPEIDRRSVVIPLSRAPKPGEKFEVTFTDDDTSPGKVLATATF